MTGGLPSQRPLTQSLNVLFDLRLNKWLSKQSRRGWFETPSRAQNMTILYWLNMYMVPMNLSANGPLQHDSLDVTFQGSCYNSNHQLWCCANEFFYSYFWTLPYNSETKFVVLHTMYQRQIQSQKIDVNHITDVRHIRSLYVVHFSSDFYQATTCYKPRISMRQNLPSATFNSIWNIGVSRGVVYYCN